MNIYNDIFNSDGSVKENAISSQAIIVTSDTTIENPGTYVLESISTDNGYPETYTGKCLLVVSGTTQPLATTQVLFANRIVWYRSSFSDTWVKDAGYTNEEVDKIKEVQETVSFIEEFRKSWIGVPRFYHGKTLPANCMWASRNTFTLGDYPEFKALWDAGAFEGMSQTYTDTLKTSALGNWLIDGSGDTAIIYTPDLRNCFFRCTGAGFQGMGGINQAGLPNITGTTASFYAYWGDTASGTTLYNGCFTTYVTGGGVTTADGGRTGCSASYFNASYSNSIYGNSNTVMPYSVNYPVMIYLGRHA